MGPLERETDMHIEIGIKDCCHNGLCKRKCKSSAQKGKMTTTPDST